MRAVLNGLCTVGNYLIYPFIYPFIGSSGPPKIAYSDYRKLMGKLNDSLEPINNPKGEVFTNSFYYTVQDRAMGPYCVDCIMSKGLCKGEKIEITTRAIKFLPTVKHTHESPKTPNEKSAYTLIIEDSEATLKTKSHEEALDIHNQALEKYLELIQTDGYNKQKAAEETIKWLSEQYVLVFPAGAEEAWRWQP